MPRSFGSFPTFDKKYKGDAYKFRYAGNDKYSQTSLKNALETRKKSYNSNT